MLAEQIEQAVPDETTEGKKKRRFSLRRKGPQKSEPLPIRILMGFLPEVSSRDAAEFALGVAEKHFDQPGVAFFDAFPYNGGYVYEAHEGGSGKAFAPEIIKHFLSLGPFEPGENHFVVVPTATRAVRVDRTREGLQCVLLPESAPAEPTPGISAKTVMRPAVNKRTGVLVGGAVLFVSGFFAMTVAQLARIPTYEPAPAVPDTVIDYRATPMAQWSRVLQVGRERYVRALKYDNGAWAIEDAPLHEEQATDTAKAVAASEAAPASAERAADGVVQASTKATASGNAAVPGSPAAEPVQPIPSTPSP